MSYSMEFGTILPTRATPTATFLILSIIVVKFWINIIVTNEENVTTPTKDIANSTVNVTLKLRLFCPVVRTIFSMNDCRLSLATNGEGVAVSRCIWKTTASLCSCWWLKIISWTHILSHLLQQHHVIRLSCSVSIIYVQKVYTCNFNKKLIKLGGIN